jgi:hypothetical protein
MLDPMLSVYGAGSTFRPERLLSLVCSDGEITDVGAMS